MTLEQLDALPEAYSFPPRVWVRLPEEGETITSARPGEVAFYEAAFPVGLRFSLHPTIRLILQFYNICPTQLVPNAWRSIICSMEMWRARNKKTLLGGYPSNVKGWKSKFFFVSGDEWELPKGSPLEGAPRVPRAWGVPDKHCNNPPRLYGNEQKGFEEIFKSVEKTGRFSVPVLLESKSFCSVFISPGSMASGTAGESRPSGEAPSSSGDVGESQNSHKHTRRQSPSQDNSVECLGSIRTELRRILPHILDLTLLRWSGGKVFDPIFNRNPSSGSNPTSESCSDSSQPVELDSNAMSKRINFKKLGEKLEKSKNGSSSGIPAPTKGIMIGEKHARENLASSASKKGKVDDGSKGKWVDCEPKGKKKATSSTNAPTTPATASSRPREGTSATLGAALGPTASILGSPSVAEKLLRGVIPPADKEKANDELAKTKSDRDSLADKVERSGVLVVELREALSKAKESAVEEFKSSSEFVVAIKDFASKYFGEGFDFCKVQLRRHHPDLAIDLEGTMVDQDLLAEQDETAEEKEKEKVGENEGGEKDTTPL
ncbi:hypothetical protein Acr_24g0008060 [Actinidia rufa]|uniref:Uncharacterized protein n=1 Tax=Actinidia rufa TaxID=165716 RepID=A0A7J0GV02_9ERIC|nr:hypothetical protein Acr_24g0008060 [Actinidia rufa]